MIYHVFHAHIDSKNKWNILHAHAAELILFTPNNIIILESVIKLSGWPWNIMIWTQFFAGVYNILRSEILVIMIKES